MHIFRCKNIKTNKVWNKHERVCTYVWFLRPEFSRNSMNNLNVDVACQHIANLCGNISDAIPNVILILNELKFLPLKSICTGQLPISLVISCEFVRFQILCVKIHMIMSFIQMRFQFFEHKFEVLFTEKFSHWHRWRILFFWLRSWSVTQIYV
jgi:hypothetical protein